MSGGKLRLVGIARTWCKRLLLLGLGAVVMVFAIVEGLRFTAEKRGVVAVGLPPGSEIARRAVGADYADAYRAPVSRTGVTGGDVTSLTFAPGREIARTDNEVVFEGGAPGLRFLASLHLAPGPDGGLLTLSTAVFYESFVGRAYFAPVGFGHRRLVPWELSRIARSLAEPGS